MGSKRARKIMRVAAAISCAVLAGSLLAGSVAAAPAPFKDMKGNWANQDVQLLRSRGVVGGFPDGTYKPNKAVSKAEFFTMLNKVMGFQSSQAPYFSDVIPDNWYYSEVAKAVAAGYIQGEYKDGGALHPAEAITRQEAASMIMKAFRANPSKDLAVLKAASFKDAHQINEWRKAAINYVLAGNIMNGFPDRTFRPKEQVTRAQIAAILNRVYEKNGGSGESNPPTASGGVIASILPLNPISVMQDQSAASLSPKQVMVKYKTGAVGKANVSWESIDTSELGKHRIYGTVAGTRMKAELLVFVFNAVAQSDNTSGTGGSGTSDMPPDIIPTVTDGPSIGDVEISFSSLMSTIQIQVSNRVTSVTANGISMHYEGNNRYSLATAGLKLGDKITIVAFDIQGNRLQKYETTVQQTNN